jgi:LDH2 family malate/lactate/ureidoglycolate dehydrogenase
MTNASNLVAPLWGAEGMLGTNPIAIAFPGQEEPPIVIDLATSAVAFGKLQIAERLGRKIPHGWAIDKDGRDTDDPQAMIDGGALLPLGSDREGGGRVCAGAHGRRAERRPVRRQLGALRPHASSAPIP